MSSDCSLWTLTNHETFFQPPICGKCLGEEGGGGASYPGSPSSACSARDLLNPTCDNGCVCGGRHKEGVGEGGGVGG